MKCSGCAYKRAISGYLGGLLACHYMVDTGKPRGCSAEECYTNRIHYSNRRKLSKTQKKAKIGGQKNAEEWRKRNE